LFSSIIESPRAQFADAAKLRTRFCFQFTE
jgi:hypothetical protein